MTIINYEELFGEFKPDGAISEDANEPPRDCRRLNFLREYDNENTKLYP